MNEGKSGNVIMVMPNFMEDSSDKVPSLVYTAVLTNINVDAWTVVFVAYELQNFSMRVCGDANVVSDVTIHVLRAWISILRGLRVCAWISMLRCLRVTRMDIHLVPKRACE
jgi:hypothetical protein